MRIRSLSRRSEDAGVARSRTSYCGRAGEGLDGGVVAGGADLIQQPNQPGSPSPARDVFDRTRLPRGRGTESAVTDRHTECRTRAMGWLAMDRFSFVRDARSRRRRDRQPIAGRGDFQAVMPPRRSWPTDPRDSVRPSERLGPRRQATACLRLRASGARDLSSAVDDDGARRTATDGGPRVGRRWPPAP